LLLLLVMGPFYSSKFNFNLLVLFDLVFCFFGLVAQLSSIYGGFLFPLLGPMSTKIFPILPWSSSSLLPYYIVDARCSVDYLIQFIGEVDQPRANSCIFQTNAKPNFKFSVDSLVWSPKRLMLESIRTKTETSRGYKSACIFIEVVLLYVSRYS
jgi:hypothetical protein